MAILNYKCPDCDSNQERIVFHQEIFVPCKYCGGSAERDYRPQATAWRPDKTVQET